MYGKTRAILFFLIFTFLATFGTILMLIFRLVLRTGGEFFQCALIHAKLLTLFKAIFFRPTPTSEFICVPQRMPDYFHEVWVPLFVHEIILLALAVNKGIQSFRSQKKTGITSRLTMVLVKDSIIYYIWFDIFILTYPYSCSISRIWLMTLQYSVFSAFFSLEVVWAVGGVSYRALSDYMRRILT